MTRRFPRRFDVLTKDKRVKHLMCSNKIPKYVGFRRNPVTAVIEAPSSGKDDAQDLQLDTTAQSTQAAQANQKITAECSLEAPPPMPELRIPSLMVQRVIAAAEYGHEVTPAIMWSVNADDDNHK